ncbi:MAG: hypothetical protein ABL895_03555 [Cyclobacteriaceae bacterium]
MIRRIWILLILISSCDSTYSTEEANIKLILKRYGHEPILDKKFYLVFAGKGCGACIEMTKSFIINNIDSVAADFIVSSDSEKEINFIFDYKIRNRNNFISDHYNLGASLLTLYPKIYFVENGTIVKDLEINYNNAEGIFKMLKERFRASGT